MANAETMTPNISSRYFRIHPTPRIRHPKVPSSTTPSLVAAFGARVGEGLARDGDELPVVATRSERELQDPRGVYGAHLAVRLDLPERIVFRPPVPTTNSLMPRSVFLVPSGFCGAKRS
jgi:hypothetical protein